MKTRTPLAALAAAVSALALAACTGAPLPTDNVEADSAAGSSSQPSKVVEDAKDEDKAPETEKVEVAEMTPEQQELYALCGPSTVDPADPISGVYAGSFDNGALDHVLIVGVKRADGTYPVHYANGSNQAWGISKSGCYGPEQGVQGQLNANGDLVVPLGPAVVTYTFGDGAVGVTYKNRHTGKVTPGALTAAVTG